MRVALVYVGRGSAYCYCAAQSLVDKCAVMAVVSRKVYNLEEWRRLPVCALHEIDMCHSLGELVRRKLYVGKVLEAVAAVRAFDADVVYVPMMSPITPVFCSLIGDKPVVLTVHDPVPHSGDRSVVKEVFRGMYMTQATRVVILSRAFVGTVARWGVMKSQIDVIPHGHLGYYRAKAVRIDAKAGGSGLLFFGRLEQYKGLPILLEAFARVKEVVPEARLRIVGRGSSSVWRRRVVEMPGVELTERWVGDEEVAGYFLEADAVVLPYTDASQSGVVAIASGLGVPCIASDVGGLAEQIKHGVNGLLVPSGDPQRLAAACVSVLRDRELRSVLAKGARSVAATEMSWTRSGDLLCHSFRRAIDDHRQGLR